MGRMKSLGYAYAEYMASEPLDVEQYFEDIIHGEVEIPKWFVNEWLQANPIFASETFNALSPICKRCGLSEAGSHQLDPTGETGICIICAFNQKMGLNAETFNADSTPRFIPVEVMPYAEWWERRFGRKYNPQDLGNAYNMSYVVLVRDIVIAEFDTQKEAENHANTARVAISVLGGVTPSEADHPLALKEMDGYKDKGIRGGMNRAETFDAEADNFYRNCSKNGWSVLGRTMHYGCSVFGKVVGGGVVVANNLNFYDKGSRILRTAGMNNDFAPALELAKVSRELQPDTMDDWSRVAQVTNDRLSQNFSAETKSWRIQNRDSSGKFTKGFVEKIDIADFMELDPEAIPEISVSITYTPEQTIDFINSMINDDDLPMRLTDSSFVNSLQSHVTSADPEMLEGLCAAAKLGLLEASNSGRYVDISGAKRAVFVTELLLNYKWGQDYWAAE